MLLHTCPPCFPINFKFVKKFDGLTKSAFFGNRYNRMSPHFHTTTSHMWLTLITVDIRIMYDTNKLDTSNIGGHGASPILQMLVDHAHTPLSWINAALSIKWHQQSIIGNRQDKQQEDSLKKASSAAWSTQCIMWYFSRFRSTPRIYSNQVYPSINTRYISARSTQLRSNHTGRTTLYYVVLQWAPVKAIRFESQHIQAIGQPGVTILLTCCCSYTPSS